MPTKTIAKILALAVIGVALFTGLVVTFRTGPVPTVEIRPEVPTIGTRTPVVVTAAAGGRGLADLRLELVQEERAVVLEERSYRTRPVWAFWGKRTVKDEIRTNVGRETVPGLRQGEAVLRVTAGRAPTWLLRPDPVVREVRLPVQLTPPELAVVSIQNYATQGGSGVVVYRVGDSSARDGVRAGEWFFPGAPLPGGGPGDRFCLFGVPWDLGDEAEVRLIAEDAVANRGETAFLDRFFPKPPNRDRITLTDSFMQRVVPEILRRTPDLSDRGNLLENYLQVNGALRRRNAEELITLAERSTPSFLWSEPFASLPNAQVMSAFADHRTYFYQGREVDQQTHLGYDLASVAHAPVPAANRGTVAMARYFGIYGNTIVLDHGYGLMSLYAHLSSMDVEEGQEVERGAVLGRTGATGLAGGDHLHFTVLVHGLPVNPTEWWDGKWIRDRVARKLGPALPFQTEPVD
jgi:murein DD-endopeptidase MepM/ murein hydrolase activator NlpD